MKVLFLDVDGVLNSQRLGTPDGMRPWCVTQLARIVKESGCKIVVSSTWRAGGIGETSDFHRCLLEASVPGDDTIQRVLIGITPDLVGNGEGARGDEIAAWLGEHPDVESFVILDDDTDMGELGGRLVRTDANAEHPLDDERAAEVLRLFADPKAMADNSGNKNPETDPRSVITLPTGKTQIVRIDNLPDDGMIVHYTGGISDVYEFREGPIPGAKPVKYNPPARLIGHLHKVERLLNGRTIGRFK
jgi:hypothetical protein